MVPKVWWGLVCMYYYRKTLSLLRLSSRMVLLLCFHGLLFNGHNGHGRVRVNVHVNGRRAIKLHRNMACGA